MMTRTRRIAIGAASLVVLAFALLASISNGVAARLQAGGAARDLMGALEWTSRDPSLHERLGLSAARGTGGRPDPERALAFLARALELRPVSPYSWAALAEARYRAGIADATLHSALMHAAALGPNEPSVQNTVAFHGLALWDKLPEPARDATRRMLAAGLKRDPEAMLRIAERHGRLDAACGEVQANARSGAMWSQLCDSRETKR